MSRMCRLGRICVPPKTVILPVFTAWFVRMLTVRSSRCRGEWPQIVAGRRRPARRRRDAALPASLGIAGGGAATNALLVGQLVEFLDDIAVVRRHAARKDVVVELADRSHSACRAHAG